MAKHATVGHEMIETAMADHAMADHAMAARTNVTTALRIIAPVAMNGLPVRQMRVSRVCPQRNGQSGVSGQINLASDLKINGMASRTTDSGPLKTDSVMMRNPIGIGR